jgi:hypothetical protein
MILFLVPTHTRAELPLISNLKQYEVQEIPFESVSRKRTPHQDDSPEPNPELLEVPVSHDGVEYTLCLGLHSMRAPDFRLFVHGTDDVIREVEAPSVSTYRGFVEECPGSRAFAYLMGQELTAHIQWDSGMKWHDIYIEPMSNYLPELLWSNKHVVYSSNDVVRSENSRDLCCASCVQNSKDSHVLQSASEPNAVIEADKHDVMKICEIACDADSTFHLTLGKSIPNTLLSIEAIVNQVSELYEREVGIKYTITSVFIRETDKLYTSLSAQNRLKELKNQWIENHTDIRRALVHLFTHKYCNKDGQNNVLGIADARGVICNDHAYILSTSNLINGPISQTSMTKIVKDHVYTLAHEVGHLWGATHESGIDGWLMNYLQDSLRAGGPLGANTIRSILSTMKSISCLIDYDAYYNIPYYSGKGTKTDPYVIRTPAQLQALFSREEDWRKQFRLDADIDISDFTFNESGAIGNETIPFTGVFDGNGHAVKSFIYESQISNNAGLFGVVDGHATIEDLLLYNPEVKATNADHVGTLIGLLRSGTVSRCRVEDGLVYGRSEVGGLVGRNLDTIDQCYSGASIEGNTVVAGLVGQNNGMILDSYSTGNVIGDDFVAGLAGACNENSAIYRCYAGGMVESGESSGGLVARADEGAEIVHSFWDMKATGQLNSAGGTGKAHEDMNDQSAFDSVGWDFHDVWEMPVTEQTGPRLRIQKYEGGTGQPENPYMIATAEQLNRIGLHPEDWDKYFLMIKNIDLVDYIAEEFNIIGRGYSNSFKGSFDGNDHTISNFTFESSTPYSYKDRGPIGLFGYLARDAEIRNVAIKGGSIRAKKAYTTGALVGMQVSGSITDCNLENAQVIGGGYTGGLVGYSGGPITYCNVVDVLATGGIRVGGLAGYSDAYIDKSYAKVDVTGTGMIGGLIGESDGEISDCHVTGEVAGLIIVGGLIGLNKEAGIIKCCYSNSTVTGWEEIAGVNIGVNIGGLAGESYGEISDCYAMGEVSVNTTIENLGHVAGLVGSNKRNGTIKHCYSVAVVTGFNTRGLVNLSSGDVIGSFWDITLSGQVDNESGEGRETAEMQTASTFLDAGWDFMDETTNGTEDIWWIDEGKDYPRLWWERSDSN